MPEVPLSTKLYFRPPYTELARLIGYGETPVPEIQKQFDAMVEKFGKEIMKMASEEMVTVDATKTPALVRLKDDVRKWCFQLLGRPPEYKPAGDIVADILAMGERLKGDPKPEKEKRAPRKKKTNAADSSPTSMNAEDRGGDDPANSSTRATSSKVTPMMQQYREAKERHPGMLILFKVGDFYELFDDDADAAAKLLGLTLTSRDGKSMAGFPHHALERYLRRLVESGKRVALCEPVEEDRKMKAAITRVVMKAGTPDDVADVVESLANE